MIVVVVSMVWVVMSTSIVWCASISIMRIWIRLYVITRVVRVVGGGVSFDGNISSSGFVHSIIHDLVFLSVLSLVGDNGHLSVFSSGHWPVFGLLDDVVPGLMLRPVLRLLLDSVVGVEDSLVPGFDFVLVLNFVLIGVPCLLLLVVLGLSVVSVVVLDLMSVSVLFLLSVEHVVAGLVHGVWNISVVSLSVGVVDDPWNELILSDLVRVVLDLVLGGISLFFVRVVLRLRLCVSVGDGYLSGPDLLLVLMADGVLDLVVEDFDVSEPVVLAVFGVYMIVLIVVVV